MKEVVTQRQPDLVFALAGPLGVDVDGVVEGLEASLLSVGYKSVVIKLTDENKSFPSDIQPNNEDYFSKVRYKMEHANALCKKHNDPAFHARLAIFAIKVRRENLSKIDSITPVGIAYIIRQLKRPAEVDLLRKVYGERFTLVSAYTDIPSRKNWIANNVRITMDARSRDSVIEQKVNELMEIDEDEGIGAPGQNLRDVFHQGDVFIDSATRAGALEKITRFVNAIFGDCSISPKKNEFGMYAARSAALRSIDLSRQVGAAILTPDGEIIAQACNEVPKAFGGTYWDDDTTDYRDTRVGHDPNEAETREVLRDVFQRLWHSKYLSAEAKRLGSATRLVEEFLKKRMPDQSTAGLLSSSAIRDITEYGRVVHAEMNAICEAARLGKSIKGGILYCTTFPCHVCTKHIIASGIARVEYIEPYPKSKARQLYSNEIDFDGTNPHKIIFTPFLGISPSKYKEIFSKGRRKDETGRARKWLNGGPRPMFEVLWDSYLLNETRALLPILGAVSKQKNSQPRSQLRSEATNNQVASKSLGPTRKPIKTQRRRK